ncbi:hypothetical protein [Citrobacter sp. CK180]|uniref:hypothetical protein n=1 Tax=Citrobacter sp. CK180 TaxID=2985089 RepID=UPI002576D4DB|nr:hypothetical protein [Citrobacter sp. CK180]MDM3063456.1 hypothetical protein [Citrobacter sp. CK180]
MTTYNTGNPLGSAAAKDLYDNAENLDHLAIDQENETWPDRLGKERKTWHGMEVGFQEIVNEYSEQLEELTDEFEETIASLGWVQMGNYAPGMVISSRNQIVFYNGYWYAWRGDLPHTTAGATPVEDGGIWSEANPDGMWVNVIGIENTASVEKATGLKIFSKAGNVVVGDSITSTGNRFAVVYGNKLRMLTNLPASGTVESIDDAAKSITIGGKKHWMLEYYGDAVNLSEPVVVGSGETMVVSGSPDLHGSSINGAGTVVGVVGNGTSMGVFDVKANVVKASERDTALLAADIIVDPMLSTAGAVATLSDALAAAAALVSGGRTADINVLLRAGRHEISPITITDEHIPGFGNLSVTVDDTTIVISDNTIVLGQNSEGRLIFKNYGREKPVITPVMNYVSSSGGQPYKTHHQRVANMSGEPHLEAYDVYMNPVKVSDNYNEKTGKLPRNVNKRIIQVVDNVYTFKLQPDDASGMINEELSSVALRINQNYSSSWNNITSIGSDGSVVYTAQGPWSTSPDGLYFDGFYYATGFSAPYWLRNATYLLSEDTYCCNSSHWYIPSKLNGIYYPDALYGFYITVSTSSVTFSGIDCAFFDIPKTSLEAIWSERFQNAGAIDISNSSAFVMENFKARNITGMFMKTSKNSSFINGFELDDVGCSGFMIANVSHNSNMIISNFKINNLGKYSVAAIGIYTVGYNVTVENGMIQNIGFAGISADSSWQDSGNIGNLVSGLFSNVRVINVGKRGGKTSDIHMASDFGAINVNAKQIAIDYHFTGIYVNDVSGAMNIRSLFLDDGVNGFRITNSFIGAVDGQYALDARQVLNGTYNNMFLNLVILGNIRLHSLTNTSMLTGIVSGDVNDFDTNGAIAFKPNSSPFRFERRGDFITAIPFNINTSSNITDYLSQFVVSNSLLTATTY